ncbi:MAG: hypothetical protein K2Y32_04550 [Candidatus Obscuribacterales bacterium]|nr:hypothetical protein [Candidatus Obscuribacterales bacterium]
MFVYKAMKICLFLLLAASLVSAFSLIKPTGFPSSLIVSVVMVLIFVMVGAMIPPLESFVLHSLKQVSPIEGRVFVGLMFIAAIPICMVSTLCFIDTVVQLSVSRPSLVECIKHLYS